MDDTLDVKRQIQAMLARGWKWSEFETDVLVHPRITVCSFATIVRPTPSHFHQPWQKRLNW